MPMKKRWAQAALGLIVGLGLCAALLFQFKLTAADWAQMARQLSWVWIVAVILLTALLWWTGAHKWALWSVAMHGAAGVEPAPHFFLKHFAWQNWFGQFVPPTVAIVLGRAWVGRSNAAIGWRAGGISGLYDQLMEFALFMLFVPVCCVLLAGRTEGWLWLAVLAASLVAAVGVFHLLYRRVSSGIQHFFWPLLGWSAVRVGLTVVRLVCGVLALGLAINLVNVVLATPPVTLVALAPITPGNLGLAEWGWVGVLAYAGENPVTCSLYALGFRLLVFVAQTLLLAGLLVGLRRFSSPSPLRGGSGRGA